MTAHRPTMAVYAVLVVQSLMASGTHIVAKVIVREERR